jgi:hypothetical protein
MLWRHVHPSLGDKQLSAILPGDVQALVKRLSTTLALGTVGVVHRILSAVFKAAVSDRPVIASPCIGTRLPNIGRARANG